MSLPPGPEELYEDAACGLLLTRADGSILRANRTFCQWLGRPAHELVSQRFQSLLSIGGRIFHQTHWAPLLKMQGSLAEVKLEVLHADGSKLPMVMNALVRRHEGQDFHELAVFSARDRHQYERELLMARRRAEALLRSEQESRRELAEARALAEDRAQLLEQTLGIVGHDLRNPLSAIQISADTLARRTLSAEQQQAVVARIRSSTGRAARLIADLLDFTAARGGRALPVNLAPVDVHAVAREVVGELAVAYKTDRLRHVAEGEPGATADADRLAQAIGNLVANALHYGRADTPVTVTSSGLAGEVRLTVHNEGQPIDPDLLPRIFEPMTRGAQAGDRRSVGLGLFIVREIAMAHGGSAECRSDAASGTTFTIRLPA